MRRLSTNQQFRFLKLYSTGFKFSSNWLDNLNRRIEPERGSQTLITPFELSIYLHLATSTNIQNTQLYLRVHLINQISILFIHNVAL